MADKPKFPLPRVIRTALKALTALTRRAGDRLGVEPSEWAAAQRRAMRAPSPGRTPDAPVIGSHPKHLLAIQNALRPYFKDYPRTRMTAWRSQMEQLPLTSKGLAQAEKLLSDAIYGDLGAMRSSLKTAGRNLKTAGRNKKTITDVPPARPKRKRKDDDSDVPTRNRGGRVKIKSPAKRVKTSRRKY